MTSERGLKRSTWSTKPSYQSWQEETYEWGRSNSSWQEEESSEIPPSFVWGQTSSKKRIGKRVFHEKFGYGTVLAEEGEKLEVSFDRLGRKKILARFVSEV